MFPQWLGRQNRQQKRFRKKHTGGEAAPSEETAAAQTALGTDVYSFQAEYAGNLIQLPVKYEDFTALGWTLSKNDSPDTMVPPGSYTMVTFNNGEASVYADMMNFGINEAAVSDCLVAGIKFDMSWGGH